MDGMTEPLFYVRLRDDFDAALEARGKSPCFPGMEDPALEVSHHVSTGRVYPVMQVRGSHCLMILDDTGFLYEAPREFFKFAETQKD